MPFDVERFFKARIGGHSQALGIGYHAHGADWLELSLPFDPRLVGDENGGVASGAIAALMDMATSAAVWMKRGRFAPQATLDLRIDYLRPTTAGRTVFGHGECLRVTPSLAFVRGHAHDGDCKDPLAHVAGTFMLLDA